MFESNIFFSMRHQNLNDYVVANHFHECYELVYYIRGTGVTTINDTAFDYTDNHFCIIPPYAVHREHTTSETDLMYIGFHYDNALGELPSLLIPDTEDLFIQNAMCMILREMSSREANYSTMLTLYLNIIIIEILRATKVKPDDSNRIELQFDYVINYIQDNFTKNFNPAELAKSIGYSYDYFRHLFKKEYGVSLKQYIIHLRIKHAKNLLQQTTKPVSEIAGECGFASCARFISLFKQKTGQSPHSYRKEFTQFTESAKYIE